MNTDTTALVTVSLQFVYSLLPPIFWNILFSAHNVFRYGSPGPGPAFRQGVPRGVLAEIIYLSDSWDREGSEIIQSSLSKL
jgi:hypothetical protein